MNFYSPVQIIAGKDRCREFAQQAAALGLHKGPVLLLTRGADFTDSPACRALKRALAGWDIREEALAVSNPDIGDMARMLEKTAGPEYSFIIACGGGSVMDTAKTLALALPARICGKDELRRFITEGVYDGIRPVPWAGIPTTSGTGSEVTPWATVWDRERECKLSCSCSRNFAALAVIDPAFTRSCPLPLTVSSALDAVCHSTESFWSRRTNDISQRFALWSLRILRDCLEELIARPDDEALRLAAAEGSLYAGIAFSNTKTTICHSVSYPMTERFGIPHGTAAALTLGDFLEFNKDAIPKYGELLRTFRCSSAAEVKAWIFRMLRLGGYAVQLRQYGITEEDMTYIVRRGFTKGRADNNPAAVTAHDLRRILQRLY